MMNKQDIVYYAEILPLAQQYNVQELSIARVTEKYFVGVNTKTGTSHLFNWKDLNEIVFYDYKSADEVVKEAKKNRKDEVNNNGEN